MDQHKIDHPHAITCYETWVKRDGDTLLALMVETDLVHDQNRKGFDKEAFESLSNVVMAYANIIKRIDTVVFSTIGDPA